MNSKSDYSEWGQVEENEVNEVLDKISEEIAKYKDDKIIHAEQNGMIDIVLGIIDKNREGEKG